MIDRDVMDPAGKLHFHNSLHLNNVSALVRDSYLRVILSSALEQLQLGHSFLILTETCGIGSVLCDHIETEPFGSPDTHIYYGLARPPRCYTLDRYTM